MSVPSLTADEVARFARDHPACGAMWERGREHLPGGVPMLWMQKWPGPWPVHVRAAAGAHFECEDGVDFVDFCLGDTGAMCGHAPPASVAAIEAQLERGATFMLPTADAAAAAGLLADRFGLPEWQFTVSATDANRSIIRYARQVTGRPKVLVHDHSYHGTVDEAYATLGPDGSVVSRRGNIGPPVGLAETTAVVPFNDVPALEAALATGEIAVVLIEPALTNIGIVLPEPGYLESVRELCTRHGAILVHDETHTLSAGPGGMTAELGLHPDAVVVGKAIGGSIPAGAWGMTRELSSAVRESLELEDIDVGGVGGTLAGNALSLAGIRATLGEVLTPKAYESMIARAVEWTEGVQSVIDKAAVPWQVTRLGCRAEYSFLDHAPRTGREAFLADDFAVQQYLHLHALNRGILMTPFHNMALMCPATTTADVDRHTLAFEQAVASLRLERGADAPDHDSATRYGGCRERCHPIGGRALDHSTLREQFERDQGRRPVPPVGQLHCDRLPGRGRHEHEALRTALREHPELVDDERVRASGPVDRPAVLQRRRHDRRTVLVLTARDPGHAQRDARDRRRVHRGTASVDTADGDGLAGEVLDRRLGRCLYRMSRVEIVLGAPPAGNACREECGVLAGAVHGQRPWHLPVQEQRVTRRPVHRPVGDAPEGRVVQPARGEHVAHQLDVGRRASVARDGDGEPGSAQRRSAAERADRLERLERRPREHQRAHVAEFTDRRSVPAGQHGRAEVTRLVEARSLDDCQLYDAVGGQRPGHRAERASSSTDTASRSRPSLIARLGRKRSTLP